jgi:hypothetical protein
VPEICRFLGIVITMYHREHEPPHFHARYAGHKITCASQMAQLRGTSRHERSVT